MENTVCVSIWCSVPHRLGVGERLRPPPGGRGGLPWCSLRTAAAGSYCLGKNQLLAA